MESTQTSLYLALHCSSRLLAWHLTYLQLLRTAHALHAHVASTSMCKGRTQLQPPTDVWCAVCSEPLDEESEPFEVLPGGCIGPSLAVTLYIMCADDQLYNSWSHMDDAVQSLQQVQKSSSAYDPAVTSTTALGSRENTSSHGSTKRKRDSLADLTHEQHSQQVGGQHSTIKRPCSQACDGSHVQKDQDRKADDGLQHEDGEHKNRDEEEWQPSIIPLRSVAKALINGRAAACLSTAVGEHLQMYKHASLTEDLEQLQKAQIQCKRLRYRDEHWKAVVSALRLVVQEKEILQEALKALQDS